VADIFISYSSKDRKQAEQLTELLASAGFSVWIDRQGIVGAEKWATEIVEGIKACSTFILLLSPNSIESENVLRELSLASEKRKRVLPVDIEPILLPSSFEYPLAGLQRVPFAEFDRIVHAHKHGVEKIIKKDERKSLMILPFDDLSPTGDNGWFADGIVSELIQALSNVKSLLLMDAQTTKDFKRYQGTLPVYAREMNIRYFVQGEVRKFGDNIKITSRLLDIETGDHLWQDSMKGTMENIFDFQEEVALKVVEGLKVHLGSDEKKKLTERGTENADAYELYLKGIEYSVRLTKEGIELSAQLMSEAIALDPGYAQAYSYKPNALAALYRTYTSHVGPLDEDLALVREALRIKPDLWSANHPLSIILTLQGKLDEAESAAQDYIRNAPDDFMSHFALGFFYYSTGQNGKAIAPYEESLKRKSEDLNTLFNLVVVCNAAEEAVKQKEYALVALPKHEKYLKLFPEDENKRVNHALLLHWADRDEEAKVAARKLGDLKDGHSLYNTACLQYGLKDYEAGLATFIKAINAGLRDIRLLKSFLNEEDEALGTLKGTPEWDKARQMVEKIEAEAKK